MRKGRERLGRNSLEAWDWNRKRHRRNSVHPTGKNKPKDSSIVAAFQADALTSAPRYETVGGALPGIVTMYITCLHIHLFPIREFLSLERRNSTCIDYRNEPFLPRRQPGSTILRGTETMRDSGENKGEELGGRKKRKRQVSRNDVAITSSTES